VDPDGNIWLVDSQAKDGKGSQVLKYTPDGKLLMALGKAGVVGDGPDEFTQPNAVNIGKDGNIFVASGHDFPTCANSRIQIFTKDGKFIKQFGAKGSGVAEVKCPHQLAFDSKGRLFVSEMGSTHRVSIFDQDGNYITAWKQFGGPTGIYIDRHDILYATDSLATDDFYMNPTQPGWAYDPGVMRGTRIGSVTDGKVTGFIPDPDQMGPAHGREVVVVDHEGNLYQVPEMLNPTFKKFVKK
jgi:DNA-binding beta-propeller fold protein YncE